MTNMKFLSCAAGLAVLEVSAAIKLGLPVEEPRVVHFPTTRELYTAPNALEKRDSTVSVTTYHDLYQNIRIVFNISLGTPPQNIGISLDTGSADLVMRRSDSAFCAAGNCTAYGSFDPSKSSTYNDTKAPFAQAYGEGTTANGTLVTDTLVIGGATVPNFTFASAQQVNVANNVFGVGFMAEEAAAGKNPDKVKPYRNGAFAMKDAGLIKTAAYSVWLNDLYAQTGSILFGGVDTAKYTGTLQAVPVVPYQIINGTNRYGFNQVSLDAVGTSRGHTTTITTPSGFPLTVLLDTGAPGLSLPQPIITDLCNAFGGCSPVQNSNINLLPCSLQAPNSGNISFLLSGVNISVPINQFIQQGGWSGGLCTFQASGSTDSSSYTLGDPFIRAVYAVYDLEAGEIALAPTVYNATGSNIVEIVNGIPGAMNASGVRTGIPSATGTVGPAITASEAGKGVSLALGVVSFAAIAFLYGL